MSTVPALSTVHTVQCTLSTARFRRSYSKHSTPCSLHWVKTETNQLLLRPAACRLHTWHCKLCTLSTVVQWALWLHTNLTESRPLQQIGLKFDLARVLRRTVHCTLTYTLHHTLSVSHYALQILDVLDWILQLLLNMIFGLFTFKSFLRTSKAKAGASFQNSCLTLNLILNSNWKSFFYILKFSEKQH